MTRELELARKLVDRVLIVAQVVQSKDGTTQALSAKVMRDNIFDLAELAEEVLGERESEKP